MKGFDLADHITDLERHQTSGRNTRFALAACSQAWKQSGLNRDTLDLDRVGIYLGSGEGPIDVQSYTKTAIASWMPNEKVVNIPIWAGEAHRLMEFRFRERAGTQHAPRSPGHHDRASAAPRLNCLTACAASTQAIGEATQILRRGDCDVAIGGGAHSMIHPFGVTGFNRLTALSTANEKPQCASRPFDGARGGFVLGEGAGMVILETP